MFKGQNHVKADANGHSKNVCSEKQKTNSREN